MRGDPCGCRIILGAALSALLLTNTVTYAESQPTTQLATASIATPAESGPAVNQSASATRVVWYNDPIVFALAIFALFAAIDIAILIAQNSHHHIRHALR